MLQFRTQRSRGTRGADKWTAFLLSLLMPGAGQVYAVSWWAVAWIAASIGFLIAIEGILETIRFPYFAVSLLAGIISVSSAIHAKRICECSLPADQRMVRKTSVTCERTTGRRVSIVIRIECACSPERLWNIVSDLETFLTLDPFHHKVAIVNADAYADETAARTMKGATVFLWHNAFCVRALRIGKILHWKPGSSFAFSDLHRHDPQRAFPHVFFVSTHSESDRASRLEIAVRGKWTSRLVPAALARYWIRLVCWEHARLLKKGLQ